MSSAVRDNRALSRFELDVGGLTAFANYKLGDGVVAILHTETPPQARAKELRQSLSLTHSTSFGRAASR